MTSQFLVSGDVENRVCLAGVTSVFFLGNKAGVTSLIAPGNGVLKR